MSDIKLGQLAPADAQRDAIHIPVIPVIAGDVLDAGDKVRMHSGRVYRVTPGHASFGVVDPFRTEPARTGERVWVLLPPGSVAVRHNWTHPAFEDPENYYKDPGPDLEYKCDDCPDWGTQPKGTSGW
jgi:hypothetical protein